MELAQIIKWVDDTNMYLVNPTESVRDYNEDIGYILEFKQYKYAITEYFFKVDKSNKEALVKRLFRECDEFIGYMRCIAEDCERVSDDYPYEWVHDIADEIFDDDTTDHNIDEALLIDLLKFYCEVINLCLESDINPEKLVAEHHREIIGHLTEFLRGSHRCKEDDDDNGKFKKVDRIDRIIAVKLLLEKAGVKGIDRTRLASFVEAVTGGNIATAPKNTYAYKYYNTKDTSEGRALLRQIGIEVKE